ncbi:potassium channel family protein [Blastopirellula retiformator]|uniref:Ion channel n=1 Tax=Blastopirellula retiformator TaxID=2527970 RepID=A0A5C5VJQ7_9BACT|nr:potassium channel family protein [Blastopirellula retiformator]TWT38838.1 Ion channel [Blastopirellula retiformator]
MPTAEPWQTPETWRQWMIQHRHAVTLVALVLLMGGETLRPDSTGSGWISDLLLSIVILASTYDVLIRHRRFVLVVMTAVPTFSMIWVIRCLDEFGSRESNVGLFVVRDVLMIGFLSYVVFLIGRDVFRAHRVTTDQILGGVSVYLLLGLIWALAYLIVVMLDPAAIDFPVESDQLPGRRTATLIYFSFTTLTTLGLGDVVPVSSLARTLTWSESVTGQLYIAVTMAKLVGLRLANLTQSQGKEERKPH